MEPNRPRISTASANTWSAAQTIDLGTGALPSVISANTQLRLTGLDGQATRVEALGFEGAAFQLNSRIASGTRATKLYPAVGFPGYILSVTAYDEATVAYTASALARYVVWTTEQHTATAKGFGHFWTATLNGAAAQTTAMWLQGTAATDPFPTLGIGAAPTAGNGLLQLASGATKAYGIAWGTDTFLYRTGANALKTDGAFSVNGALEVSSAVLIKSNTTLTNGAAAAAGTLLNAPSAGNPTKWIPINDNGTTRYIPAW